MRKMEITPLVEKYKVSVSTFFMLGIPDAALRAICKSPPFAEERGAPPSVQVAPGVSIGLGPPIIPIAAYNDTKVGYNPEKFMLRVEGSIDTVVEVLKQFPSLFEKYGYSLGNIARYYEVHFDDQPIEISNVVKGIKARVKFEGVEELKELLGEKLDPYQISVSNMESPLSDSWFNIRITPESNSPHRALLRIIKRESTIERTVKFLDNINPIIGKLRELLKGA